MAAEYNKENLENELVYEWKLHPQDFPPNLDLSSVKIHDESHRDGLQSRKLKEPNVEETISQIRLMNQAGIDCANIGFPISSPIRNLIIREVAKTKTQEDWKIDLMCASRLNTQDIASIIDISQETGTKLWVGTFIAASQERARVMGWDLREMAKLIPNAVQFAKNHQLPVMFVTEDSSRSHPDNIALFNQSAIEAGANRLCITDTVGYVRENAVRKLVGFVKHKIIRDQTVDSQIVELEWHGHQHRGLALSNTLAAMEAGANRVEGTLLGRGEMMGNCPTELIALNMVLEDIAQFDLKLYAQLCQDYAKSIGVQIPDNWPLVGEHSYLMGSGVHADAYLKALDRGNPSLADTVYCAYSPSLVGREIDADLNPNCGRSSIIVYLRNRGILDPTQSVIDQILTAVKSNQYTLTDPEIMKLVEENK